MHKAFLTALNRRSSLPHSWLLFPLLRFYPVFFSSLILSVPIWMAVRLVSNHWLRDLIIGDVSATILLAITVSATCIGVGVASGEVAFLPNLVHKSSHHRWILVSGLGWGIGVAWVVATIMPTARIVGQLDHALSSAILGSIITGGLGGLIIGGAQALMLWRHRLYAVGWLIATILGGSIGLTLIVLLFDAMFSNWSIS